MNPVITVLCTAAICCELENKPAWTGVFLIIAMLVAGWQNSRQWKLVKIWMARNK